MSETNVSGKNILLLSVTWISLKYKNNFSVKNGDLNNYFILNVKNK